MAVNFIFTKAVLIHKFLHILHFHCAFIRNVVIVVSVSGGWKMAAAMAAMKLLALIPDHSVRHRLLHPMPDTARLAKITSFNRARTCIIREYGAAWCNVTIRQFERRGDCAIGKQPFSSAQR